MLTKKKGMNWWNLQQENSEIGSEINTWSAFTRKPTVWPHPPHTPIPTSTHSQHQFDHHPIPPLTQLGTRNRLLTMKITRESQKDQNLKNVKKLKRSKNDKPHSSTRTALHRHCPLRTTHALQKLNLSWRFFWRRKTKAHGVPKCPTWKKEEQRSIAILQLLGFDLKNVGRVGLVWAKFLGGVLLQNPPLPGSCCNSPSIIFERRDKQGNLVPVCVIDRGTQVKLFNPKIASFSSSKFANWCSTFWTQIS